MVDETVFIADVEDVVSIETNTKFGTLVVKGGRVVTIKLEAALELLQVLGDERITSILVSYGDREMMVPPGETLQ